MCGITGIISKESRTKESEIRIRAMMDSIKYRGPDENGIHVFDNCIIGHNRLSIIDISSGKQPMITNDGNIGIVFNGEIYGYKDIKKTLSDYNFKNNSDTEVILALYEKYGDKLLEKLPGMFAFAIWNEKKQELFCARDRFGEKPFYYAYGKNNELIFASEIKAIITSKLIEPKISLDSVIHYLKHLYVNPYKTIYSNIYTLPPAHALKYLNGEINIWRYWEPPSIDQKISLEKATEKFKELFHKAVKSQLIADVPIGAFLSGGLDSSSVVAVASKYTKKLKTLSFRFKDGYNELPFAKEISKKYDTDHIELEDGDYDIASLLLKMRGVFDEPFADSSNISTYIISNQASKYVKVILTGDGGDELLGGYTAWYRPFLYAKGKNNKLNPWIKTIIPYLIKALYRTHLPYRKKLGEIYAGKILDENLTSVIKAHEAQNMYFTEEEINSLFIKKPRTDKYHPYWILENNLNDVMRMDIDNYMPGDILTKIDRASMANSIELRAPFLDMDFASFCLSLPYRLKINKKSEKIILRNALSEYIPSSIKKREKHGFGAQVDKWLKLNSVKKLKKEFLDDKNKKIFKLLSYEEVKKIYKKDNYQTWALLVLSIWIDDKTIDF